MTPFSVPPSMETFTETHPSGADVLKTAYEGGPDACKALARTWITEGIPTAFAECPAVYDSMRVWLANELSIDPKQIGLTGSARFGSSFVPSRADKPFGPRSDLDFFLVSDALFTAYRADFCSWRDDFRSGRVKAKNAIEQGHWEDNAERVPKNIRHRFIDVKKIPARRRYRAAQRTLNLMYLLTEKLKVTLRSPSPRQASVRCYEDWGSVIKQMSMSLERSGRTYAKARVRSRRSERHSPPSCAPVGAQA